MLARVGDPGSAAGTADGSAACGATRLATTAEGGPSPLPRSAVQPESAADEQLVASLLDLVVRVGSDGLVLSGSGGCELLLGRVEDQLRGLPLTELVAPEHQSHLRRLLAGERDAASLEV